MKELFELLAMYGGNIVSTNSLDVEDIKQAKASNRMFVDEESLGYVWMPDIVKFPETVEEVEFYERWFPLAIKVPKEINDYVLQRIKLKQKGALICPKCGGKDLRPHRDHLCCYECGLYFPLNAL